MSKHLGDFDAGITVYGKFTTYDPTTGAPFTLGGGSGPGLMVYKDGSLTQSIAGLTLTTDFDGFPGLNHFALDLSADGTFYAAGSFFEVVIANGSVNGVSVQGAVVAAFTLRRTAALRPQVAGRELEVNAGGHSGLDWNNVVNQGSVVNLTNTTIKDVTDIATDVAAVKGDTAAIKAKTDSLNFTVAGTVDSNVQYVNDTQVVGTGAVGNEWGPA